MNIVKTTIITGLALFLTVGIAGADELDDMEITIRVVEHDDDIVFPQAGHTSSARSRTS